MKNAEDGEVFCIFAYVMNLCRNCRKEGASSLERIRKV